MSIPPLSLVLGGSSSGKSAFAESLVRFSGLARVYIATADPDDATLSDSITAHQEARLGQNWRTIEAPLEAASAMAGLETEEIALLDCASVWLGNVMRSGKGWDDETELLADTLAEMRAPVVIVSCEVGHGLVPKNSLAREYRRAQGRLNQLLAAQADLVVQVTAGLPIVLKGDLPWEEAEW